MAELKVTDEEINAKWQQMVALFKKIIEGNPAPEKVRQKLTDLKAAADQSHLLTGRQKEGIHGRCDNYLNGT